MCHSLQLRSLQRLFFTIFYHLLVKEYHKKSFEHQSRQFLDLCRPKGRDGGNHDHHNRFTGSYLFNFMKPCGAWWVVLVRRGLKLPNSFLTDRCCFGLPTTPNCWPNTPTPDNNPTPTAPKLFALWAIHAAENCPQ